MNKVVKGVYLTIGCIILGLLFYILTLFPNQISVNLRPSPNWIAAPFLFLTSGIIVVFNSQLYRIIRIKKDNALIAELLFGVFAFFGLMTIIQGLFGIINFSPVKLNLLFTQSIYIFLGGSLVLLNSFILEVFGSGMKSKNNMPWFWIRIIFASISTFGIVMNILVGIDALEAIITGLPAAISLIYLFLKFIVSSFNTSKKLAVGIVRKSFQFMGLGGIGIFGGILLIALGAVTKFNMSMSDAPEYLFLIALVHFLILGGMGFIYVGFTRPIKTGGKNVNPNGQIPKY